MSTVDWAEANFVLVDGPLMGQRWDRTVVPYMIEILDEIDSDENNIVTVRKSAQVSFTTAAMAWMFKNIDTAPDRELVIFPTLSSVQDFNRDKLSPAMEVSPAMRRKVRAQKSRSASGSTIMNKQFAGGSISLTGANSSVDLRSKTTRRQFRDEIDEWPLDLEGQGDPYSMADARMISFHATGEWKVLEGSTPTIKGASRIDQRFDDGDRRYYQVPCPHCGKFQRLIFGGKDTKGGLKFSTEFPYKAWYACEHNGCVIQHHEKRDMVARGKFVAEKPGPGRHPSFHIDALISNLTTWDDLVVAFLKARNDPQKLKGFVNLWLGESWEVRGDAPDWKLLMLKREDFPRTVIPPGGLILTGAADIQADGIYYEIIAWGSDLQSWSIDVGFLPGATAGPRAQVWKDLDAVYQRKWPDAHGGEWPTDAFAVDAGYNTQTVYDWCRRRPKARAIKGVSGWYKPAIARQPSQQDISYGGRKVKYGVKLWPVGTWSLKSALYYNIRKEGVVDGEDADPPGYCHFATWHDEGYFKQLTAEHLKEREHKGRIVKDWVANGPNHYHDCRIYGMAMAEHLGLSNMTGDQWAKIAADRGVPAEVQKDFSDRVEAVPARPKKARRRLRGRVG